MKRASAFSSILTSKTSGKHISPISRNATGARSWSVLVICSSKHWTALLQKSQSLCFSSTQCWRKNTDLHGMPWPSMREHPRGYLKRSVFRYMTSTFAGLQSSLGLGRSGRYMKQQLKRSHQMGSMMTTPGQSVPDMLSWSASLARLTGHVLYTRMHPICVIPEKTSPSGMSGTALRSSMAMRTLSVRCCASNAPSPQLSV
mmetsp:Transcript_19095/g.53218  ORF Transcript_19095/g.53218 Transcript_19095/m.53218 type:complete len:201 (+) Transcript_19095:1999-2601(+)